MHFQWDEVHGKAHEKVHDVAWAGRREIDPRTGKLPPIGSTINFSEGTYDNSIGENYLSGLWVDPEFDPKLASFYYCRVIEIPRPRWTLKDAAFFNIELDQGVTKVVQDRAYTSPIWYTP